MALAEVAQIIGAVLVLTAFVVTQNGMGSPDSIYVLVLNTVGAGILAYLALVDSQWGFLVLEGVWSLLAGYNLLKALRRQRHDHVLAHARWTTAEATLRSK